MKEMIVALTDALSVIHPLLAKNNNDMNHEYSAHPYPRKKNMKLNCNGVQHNYCGSSRNGTADFMAKKGGSEE